MKYLIALLLCSVPCIAQTDLKTERLQKIQAVHTIFVDGNNVGALKAREQIEKGKTCDQQLRSATGQREPQRQKKKA